MPFRPPSDEEIAENEKKDRKKRIEEYAKSHPPDSSYDDSLLKVKHKKSVYDEAAKGMPAGERDQSYLREITKPMEQREKERKKKKEPKTKYTANSQDDGFEEYRSRRMKGEDITMYDIKDEESTPNSKKERKEKKSWADKKLERKRRKDELAEIEERSKERRERSKERRHAEEMRRIEEKQAKRDYSQSKRESRKGMFDGIFSSSSHEDYEETAPRPRSAPREDSDTPKRPKAPQSKQKPRSTGSKAKPKSTTTKSTKTRQSKPTGRSATTKGKGKGKSTAKKKTPAKGKGKGKKRSPPKGGMFWSYGDAGL